LTRLYAARDLELDSPYIFVHARDARHAGKPVLDVKNAFHTALEDANNVDFTWHDFRHDYASRLVMAGVSLHAVAELLGHKGLRMVMRYAISPPGFLSEEVKKLDSFTLSPRSVARARIRATSRRRPWRSGETSQICSEIWLAALDDFRNWLALGLQPAKAHENRPWVRMAPAGAARSNRASGAVEAEQLFDPERA
jgi:hypothetical protein